MQAQIPFTVGCTESLAMEVLVGWIPPEFRSLAVEDMTWACIPMGPLSTSCAQRPP